MPPKNASKCKPSASGKKTKKVQAPVTPAKSDTSDEEQEVEETPTKKPKSRSKPKKPTQEAFTPLKSDVGDAAPVDVSFHGEVANSKLRDAKLGGGHEHIIKLHAPQPFTVVASTMLTDGKYTNHQALIIAPSPPFPFLKLPHSVRHLIYEHAFTPTDNRILISTDRKKNLLRAPDYSRASPHRLALLSLNKETSAEARAALYSTFTLAFDTPATATTFLSHVGPGVRALLTSVELVSYNKSSAVACWSLLGSCAHLQKVYVHAGFGVCVTPGKLGREFWNQAWRFLSDVVGKEGGGEEQRAQRGRGLEILTFGPECLTVREGGEVRKWGEAEVEEFTGFLREKLG